MIKIILLFAVSCFFPLFSNELYTLNAKANFEVHGMFRGLSLQIRGEQTLKGTLQFSQENRGVFFFTLEDLKVQESVNGSDLSFDVKHEGLSQTHAGFATLLGVPIEMHLSEQGEIKVVKYDYLMKQSPYFSKIMAEGAIYSLFSPLFPLFGERVEEGRVYFRPFEGGGIHPDRLEFSMDDVSTKEVKGKILGNAYKSHLPVGDGASAIVNGTIEGTGIWSRGYPPVSVVDLEYDYMVRLIFNGQETLLPVHLNWHAEISPY